MSSRAGGELEMNEPMIDSESASPITIGAPSDADPISAPPASAVRAGGVRRRGAGGSGDGGNQRNGPHNAGFGDEQTLCGCRRPQAVRLIALAVLIVFAIVLISIVISVSQQSDSGGDAAPSTDAAAIAACAAARRLSPVLKSTPTPANLQGGTLLVQHATLWNGLNGTAGAPQLDVDIQIVGGRIAAISAPRQRLTPLSSSSPLYDASGRIVTPGIVDAHNHAGVYAWPDNLWATQDGNEETDPVTPFVRAVDGLDPEDWAIPYVRAYGGVTTAQILPGSANVMGGEGVVVKFRGKTVQDMILEGAPRPLKMACGENPKRVYGSGRNQMPASRMGSAWLARQWFDRARTLRQQQDAWCANWVAGNTPNGDYPQDLSLDGLVQDLEMMIRTSKEFGFNISAFHHALEAYKIPGQLVANGIAAATFADLWGYKFEAYDASVHGPKTLYDAGVSLVLKTDHPVIIARNLMYEAAKAHHYGVPTAGAIAAVTSNPAKAIGIDNRVGSVQIGLDGDLVVWDRDPLLLSATPNAVVIDGNIVSNTPTQTYVGPTSDAPPAGTFSVVAAPTAAGGNPCDAGVTGTPAPLSCYYVQNVANLWLNPTTQISSGAVQVVDGVVTCAGTAAACPAPSQASCVTLDMSGGTVIPGLFESLSHVGQVEIGSESTTDDGVNNNAAVDPTTLDALDGVRMQTRHVSAAFAGGVNTVLSYPEGSSLVRGVSVAYRTCFAAGAGVGCGLVVDDVVVAKRVALHLTMGDAGKNGGSVSGEFAELRAALNAAAARNSTASDVWVDVLNGRMPLVVHVYQGDVMARLIHLKTEYPTVRLVVANAGEATVIASRLAAANIPVLLETRVNPSNFLTIRARDNALARLLAAGVQVGLAMADTDNTRNLRWEAGFAIRQSTMLASPTPQLSFGAALAAVTTGVAQVLGLPTAPFTIAVGQTANFVAYDDDPFSLRSHIQFNAVGSFVTCKPQQF